MREDPRWVTEPYRGMYAHGLAIRIDEERESATLPGQRWGYVLAISFSARPSDRGIGLEQDQDDYYTAEAAEQAALHYGKLAIDVLRDMH